MRPSVTEACDEMIRVEARCFERWCELSDHQRTRDPDVVVASQEPVHHVAGQLRRLCLAGPETAEADRHELMRLQAEGEIRCDIQARMNRTAAARDAARRQWASERYRIFCSRDTLTVGLGWPHRGELVTVDISYWRGPDGEKTHVTGTAVYLNSYDLFDVGHQVWVPELGARRRGTLLVSWEPRLGHWETADPAGDIGLRVHGAESRRLPVPLPRFPKPEDLQDGGPDPVASTPVGAQLELFT